MTGSRDRQSAAFGTIADHIGKSLNCRSVQPGTRELGCDGGCLLKDAFADLSDPSSDQRQAEPRVGRECLPAFCIQLGKRRAFPDLHRKLRRKIGIGDCCQPIIERGEAWAFGVIKNREILAVRIGVPGDHVEDHGIEKLQYFDRRPCCDASDKPEAIFEGWKFLKNVYNNFPPPALDEPRLRSQHFADLFDARLGEVLCADALKLPHYTRFMLIGRV